MYLKTAFSLLAILCAIYSNVNAQSTDSSVQIPSGLLGKIQAKTAGLNQDLSRQMEKYLEKMQRREEKLRQKLYKTDSNAAKQLFANSSQQYTAVEQKMRTDTGRAGQSINGAYLPYADSLQGSLAFLKQNPQLLNTAQSAQLQGASSQMQALEAKMQDADAAKAFMQQRKQQIAQYISQHTELQGILGKDYAGMNQDVYYYSQQLRQYKEMWNNPDQLEQKALALLNQLPSFQTFMKNNSQLAGLFNLPGSYASGASLTGLQTKDQVAQLMQGQISSGGSAGMAAYQSNMQAAGDQMDSYRAKIGQLGGSNGDIDLPDFKPNDQKTKTFLKRLEYGVNFQTTRTDYMFPTVADFGLSVGYKLNGDNVIGVGASYKLGLGNGWQNITLSNQGVGLRSFIEIKIKSTFFATGGYEMNYTSPFDSFKNLQFIQNWTRSGLIGISKTVSTKSKVFKKTKLQLLWDFLSYQNVPKTQPIIFRIGYTF